MHTQNRRILVAALGAVLVLPAAALAQHSLDPIKVTEKQAQADRLDREAEGYEQTDVTMWRKSASLRREAAKLRGEEDPRGAVSLAWAARDSYYGGDIHAGRDLMVQSAERALAVGDVVVAASGFTEAAYIALELRDGGNAKYYAARARLLSNSPMLSDAQRTAIRSRLAIVSASPIVLASR